jgi:hypothetical protein
MSQLIKMSSNPFTLHAQLLVIIAICSAAMSYWGYQSLWPSFEGKVLASIMAVVTFTTVYLYHSFTMKALMDNVSLRKRLMVLMAALLFFVFIAGLSSAINVTAISGSAAQVTYIKDFTKKISDVTNRTYQDATRVRQFLPLFELEKMSWKAAASEEKRLGAYSHFAGGGGVYAVLNRYADHYANLEQQTQIFLKKIGDLHNQVNARLIAIRELAEKPDTPEQRMKAIALEVDKINALLVKMQGDDLIAGFNIIINNLPNEVRIINLSKNQRIANGQQAAIAKIKDRLSHSVPIVRQAFAEYQSKSISELPTLEPMSTLRAVVEYWYLYPQAWIAGLAIDLLPLFLGVILLILRQNPASTKQNTLMRKQMTVDELFSAQDMLTSLHQSRLNRQPEAKTHQQNLQYHDGGQDNG